jgi:hypothetical protein
MGGDRALETGARFSVSYAEAEFVLARLHGADAVQRKAFRGRLKHLKRLGIPSGIAPGKGAKIFYYEAQLYEWALCLELAEFGIDPTVIVRLIEESWQLHILPRWIAFHNALLEEKLHSGPDPDLFFHCFPNAMSQAWSDGQPLPFKLEVLNDYQLARLCKNRRLLLINISALDRQIGVEGVKFQSKQQAQ